MDSLKMIQNIKSLPVYSEVLGKLTVDPQSLTDDEKTFILACAIILIKKYEKDKRYTSYIELAYYIILKYSLSFEDFEPLYDFSVNMGFYPISQAIAEDHLIEFNNIAFSLIPNQIRASYLRGNITETLEQHHTRNRIISSLENEICFVAPTSFGKSSIIIDHIVANIELAKRVAIIVPTKSLLMQTYRTLRNANLSVKILIHDEMFDGEERFVAVFTQERALRLLDKNDICFDTLYIDEAHRLFERDSRSILLSRLIKLNHKRNQDARVVYLSPLITETDNLRFSDKQKIFEQRISFNIKEPEYFEYRTNGSVYKYNRFLDKFFEIDHCRDLFEYVHRNKTHKTFCYLYTPRKIEQFARALSASCPPQPLSESVKEIIKNLKAYVHEDFYVIDYLKKGIVYLHGKMPDNIKEYLEYKFSHISQLKFLIANKVILEGINLPIDSIFILSGRNLQGKELTNLIGRVNRLDQVFGISNNLKKLMPPVHFVNSDEYNRANGKLENKMRLLRNSTFADNVKNPLLNNFDTEQTKKSKDIQALCETIISNEETFFSEQTNPIQVLKQKMIALGMNSIYNISDTLCNQILLKIERLKIHSRLYDSHFLDRLRYVFVRHFDNYIINDEFSRLKNDKAIAYYKMFFENRKRSLKENIAAEVLYLKKRVRDHDSLLYIGESYGEIPYPSTGKNAHRNVYIDLDAKTEQEMVNIAIVKQKMEEDFVSYTLHMFFQLMFDYELLSLDEYQRIIYGTTDPKKMQLVKMGLTINIINRLDSDGQLKNISIDDNNNLIPNDAFKAYKDKVDDFYRFELNKFL